MPKNIAEPAIFYGEGLNDMTVFNNFAYQNDNYELRDDTRYIIKIEPPASNGNNVISYRFHGVKSGLHQGQNYVGTVVELDQSLLNTYGQYEVEIQYYYAASNSPVGYFSTKAFTILFNQNTGHTVGDSWRVSCRGWCGDGSPTAGGMGQGATGTGYSTQGQALHHLVSNGVGSNQNVINNQYGADWLHGGMAIAPLTSGWDLFDSNGNPIDRPIKAGAILTFEIKDAYNNCSNSLNGDWQPQMTFSSSADYENIEEWFYEEGINQNGPNGWSQEDVNGNNIYSDGIIFRRGKNASMVSPGGSCIESVCEMEGMLPSDWLANHNTYLKYPVRMIVQGFGNRDECDSSRIILKYNITQQENPNICETDPIEVDNDIFYETTDTFPITNTGYHKVLWDYEDFTFPDYATINGTGYTNIGQASPPCIVPIAGCQQTPPGSMRPHNFQVGDEVVVTGYSTVVGTHTVLLVRDAYNIVIDLLAPGAAPVTPGTVAFNNEERDQSYLNPAVLYINHPSNSNSTYNAYAFGNGVESDRIRDDFGRTELEYSPRASTIIENYSEERNQSSLTYSGVYQESSSINKLNEFNLSNVNFKSLDDEYGSIQKLYARDTDLMVFQEDKISRVLYGKNLISDSTGGGQIASVPQVLGTQIADKGEWGISFNPESFAQWGKSVFWCDERRGVVLGMNETTGIVPISSYGMRTYFRDLFKDNTNTQRLGVFDPYSKKYVVASNDLEARPCSCTLTSTGKDYSWDNGGSGSSGPYSTPKPDFSILCNTSWTTAIAYSSGSGWVSGVPTSGSGDQTIYLDVAPNTSAVVRTATITFTFCGGQEVVYTVTQGAGPIVIYPWVD